MVYHFEQYDNKIVKRAASFKRNGSFSFHKNMTSLKN